MSKYSLFSVMGIEIEYMLVDKEELNIQPLSDRILHQMAKDEVNEVELGDIAISNELVMHVIELKNNGPKPASDPIAEQFHSCIKQLQPVLDEYNLIFLPTAAHPWMNPVKETKRWPHGNMEIYQQFDTIFNCQGHGWANLQSMHINLPFGSDEEFAYLHNAIRLLLPLLPALAASSPLLEGRPTGMLDSRLSFYGKNQAKVPSISGDIIPDYLESEADYQEKILQPMFLDIKPYDPKGILQHEWLNSRAAIPKFEYNAIEIRILDSQECPQADLAIAKLIHALLKYWHPNWDKKQAASIGTLQAKAYYDASLKQGLKTMVDDSALLAAWKLPKRNMPMRDIWNLLIETVSHDLDKESQLALEHILSAGNLSERILQACRKDYSRENLKKVYRKLSDCLYQNTLYRVL